MLYALVIAAVIALAGGGFGAYQLKAREAAEAEAKASKQDANVARDERDRAIGLARSSEAEAEKERGRSLALDALLVEKDKNQKQLEQDKLGLKTAYDEIKGKLDDADKVCLARDLPESIRLRLKP